jgi:hypothetical protein
MSQVYEKFLQSAKDPAAQKQIVVFVVRSSSGDRQGKRGTSRMGP